MASSPGKDGTIKHAYTFLWRSARCIPPRGKIGIFNRSYYEEVLVVRVHPEFVDMQLIPDLLRGKHFWKDHYEDINAFERYLTRNGIAVRKFFLSVSKEEQKRRFLARLDDPTKNRKFFAADIKKREYWDDYMDAHEKMIAQQPGFVLFKTE